MKEVVDRINLQNITQIMMENLDEGIVSFKGNNLIYLNKNGFGIVDEI